MLYSKNEDLRWILEEKKQIREFKHEIIDEDYVTETRIFEDSKRLQQLITKIREREYDLQLENADKLTQTCRFKKDGDCVLKDARTNKRREEVLSKLANHRLFLSFQDFDVHVFK